jgi:FMN phosphatase YigB (HAD superfamily)
MGVFCRRAPYDDDSSLTKVEVLFFDLDGTVLDWRATVAEALRQLENKHFPQRGYRVFKWWSSSRLGTHWIYLGDSGKWEEFASKWREEYLATMFVPSFLIYCS